MNEDKTKLEYDWQHRTIGQPDLDELFDKINKALGIELRIWQKTYIATGIIATRIYRQTGATTAECLRLLLTDIIKPIDFSKPPRTAKEASEREQFREIYQKLNEAGIATRTVFWSRKEKENWYEIKDLEKELEEAVEAHHGDNEDGRAIWETIKKCRDSNTTKQWHC